jgi:RNA polymerase sigma factor (TIGR02999 family)
MSSTHGKAPDPAAVQVTELLVAWSDGDRAALDHLVPLVHQELRRLARRQMGRERRGHMLQTTALVNEAYLRLIDINRVRWQDRSHFFAMSASLMRRILVEHARARKSLKRGGASATVSLDDTMDVALERGVNLIALDDALQELAKVDARKSSVVEMRFFGGLTAEETAEALGVSVRTVLGDWALAKVWLLRQLDRDRNP